MELTKKQAEHLKHIAENANGFLRQRQEKNYAECVLALTSFFKGYLSESDIPFAAVIEMISALADKYLFTDKEPSSQKATEKYLLVTQCELDKCASATFCDSKEEAEKRRAKFYEFCSGFPCGIITAAIFDVKTEEHK